MKTPQQYDSLLGRLEADIQSRIRSLFARCPTLHGFAVQDRAMLPKDLDEKRIPAAALACGWSCTRSEMASVTSCTTSRTPTITCAARPSRARCSSSPQQDQEQARGSLSARATAWEGRGAQRRLNS